MQASKLNLHENIDELSQL